MWRTTSPNETIIISICPGHYFGSTYNSFKLDVKWDSNDPTIDSYASNDTDKLVVLQHKYEKAGDHEIFMNGGWAENDNWSTTHGRRKLAYPIESDRDGSETIDRLIRWRHHRAAGVTRSTRLQKWQLDDDGNPLPGEVGEEQYQVSGFYMAGLGTFKDYVNMSNWPRNVLPIYSVDPSLLIESSDDTDAQLDMTECFMNCGELEGKNMFSFRAWEDRNSPGYGRISDMTRCFKNAIKPTLTNYKRRRTTGRVTTTTSTVDSAGNTVITTVVLDPGVTVWRDVAGTESTRGVFNISLWGVSRCETFTECFADAGVRYLDLSKWQMGSAKNLDHMFKGLRLERLVLGRNGSFGAQLDFGNVTSMRGTFQDCDVEDLLVFRDTDHRDYGKTVSEVKKSDYHLLKDLPLLDTSNVTDMTDCLRDSNMNPDLSQWDVNSVTEFDDFRTDGALIDEHTPVFKYPLADIEIVDLTGDINSQQMTVSLTNVARWEWSLNDGAYTQQTDETVVDFTGVQTGLNTIALRTYNQIDEISEIELVFVWVLGTGGEGQGHVASECEVVLWQDVETWDDTESWTEVTITSITDTWPGSLRSIIENPAGETLPVVSTISKDGNSVAGVFTREKVIRVFDINSAYEWTQRGDDIQITDSMQNSLWYGIINQGAPENQRLSFSADGNTLAVGLASNGFGGVSNWMKVFKWQGGSWSQLGSDIGWISGFGAGVDLSDDGTRVAVLIESHGFEIYDLVNGNWSKVGSTVTVSDFYNPSIACNGDASIIVIGRRKAGAVVYQFNTSSNDWEIKGSPISISNPSGQLPMAVDITTDGDTIAIASPNSDYSYVYEWDGSVWSQKGASIPNQQDQIGAGVCISISSDGNTVLIGDSLGGIIGNDSGTAKGTVTIFSWNTSDGEWNQVYTLDGDNAGEQASIARLTSDGSQFALSHRGQWTSTHSTPQFNEYIKVYQAGYTGVATSTSIASTSIDYTSMTECEIFDSLIATGPDGGYTSVLVPWIYSALHFMPRNGGGLDDATIDRLLNYLNQPSSINNTYKRYVTITNKDGSRTEYWQPIDNWIKMTLTEDVLGNQGTFNGIRVGSNGQRQWNRDGQGLYWYKLIHPTQSVRDTQVGMHVYVESCPGFILDYTTMTECEVFDTLFLTTANPNTTVQTTNAGVMNFFPKIGGGLDDATIDRLLNYLNQPSNTHSGYLRTITITSADGSRTEEVRPRGTWTKTGIDVDHLGNTGPFYGLRSESTTERQWDRDNVGVIWYRPNSPNALFGSSGYDRLVGTSIDVEDC